MEVHRRHVHRRQEEGEEHTGIPQHRQGRGRQPVLGPVLAGAEKLAHGARQEISQGDAVGQDPHPSLQQAPAEPVGPLGGGQEGEGGARLVPDPLLQVGGLQEAVGVQGLQPLLHPGHQGGVCEAVDGQDVHRGQGLPAHHHLGDAELRGPEAAADQGGVGAEGFHKGVLGPQQGGLVLRGGHRPLFLGGGGVGHHGPVPGEVQDHRPVHQGGGGLVQGGHRPGGLAVDRPPEHPVQGLRPVGGGQGGAGSQGAEDVVVHPLRPHLSLDEVGGGPLGRVPADEDGPPVKVGAAGKPGRQGGAGEGALQPGLPPGVVGDVGFLGAQPFHGGHVLSVEIRILLRP